MVLTQAIYEVLKKHPYRTATITYKRNRFKVQIADSFMKKMVGLMYRKGMGKEKGMLFPIAQPGILSATVTMMNMRFGIDIVWLDSRGTVVSIEENAKPSSSMFDSHAPKKAAAYILELGAGRARRLGIKIGGRIALGRLAD